MASKKPRTFDDLYVGRFLKAGNFDGRKVTLTIKDYDVEVLEGDDGPKSKAIISFKETERQLVACKTNGLCLKSMFGADLRAWVGKKVILFPSTWNNEPCIRVWGSPDIKADASIEIRLPRRKPFTMRLHRSTGEPSNGQQQREPAPENEPGPPLEVDDDLGPEPPPEYGQEQQEPQF